MRSITERPEEDQDILLSDEQAVWNVATLNDPIDGRPKLTRLRWNRAEAAKSSEQFLDATTQWRPADVKFIFLSRVALGKCYDYGSKFAKSTNFAPTGYHSWSGTEGDLDISNLTEREKFDEYAADCKALLAKGSEYGRQYIVGSDASSYTYPAYLIEYECKRTRPKPQAAGSSSRKRKASA